MKNGASSHFYDNMARVRPGDIVFSYAGGEIRAVGVAMSRASSAAKPSEFGQTGLNWGNDGWFVPVEFKLVSLPLRPKDHIGVIAPLLPEKYSPLQTNGNGNQVAYLSLISEVLATRLLTLLDTDTLIKQLKGVGTGSEMEEEEEQVEEKLIERQDISETEKDQLVSA
jgi:hypothetical protein